MIALDNSTNFASGNKRNDSLLCHIRKCHAPPMWCKAMSERKVRPKYNNLTPSHNPAHSVTRLQIRDMAVILINLLEGFTALFLMKHKELEYVTYHNVHLVSQRWYFHMDQLLTRSHFLFLHESGVFDYCLYEVPRPLRTMICNISQTYLPSCEACASPFKAITSLTFILFPCLLLPK